MTRSPALLARQVLAVLLGAVVGSVVLFLVGMIANAINPTPPELMDPATPEAVARRVAATAIGAVLSLWAFYTFYVVFPAFLWVPALMLIPAFLFSYLGGTLVVRLRRA